MAKFPTIEEMAQNVAEKALDEVEYEGKTLREWVKIILATDINVGTKDGTNLAEVGTEAVSRRSVIDAVRAALLSWSSMPEWRDNKIIEAVEQLPPIQPEIIRCKDCKHWIPYDWMFSEVWQSKNIADYPEDEIGCNWCDMAMKADDFCSYGERREVTT